MKSILTNENNDIYINSLGEIAMGEDLVAVTQVVQNSVLTLRGEVQYDTTIGIPYFDTILCSNPNVSLWESYMTQEVEKIDNVLKVDSIETTVEDGVANYEMKITTKFGETTVTG